MKLAVGVELASLGRLAAVEKCSRLSGQRLSDLKTSILDPEKALRCILNAPGEPIMEILVQGSGAVLVHTESMSTKFTSVLALAAGFLGGLASHYCVDTAVWAQEKASIPQEIQAHKFLLVDENGVARGAFGFDKHGTPNIEVMDVKGHKWEIGMGSHNSPELLPDVPKNASKSK